LTVLAFCSSVAQTSVKAGYMYMGHCQNFILKVILRKTI